jgi:hypothetical protein
MGIDRTLSITLPLELHQRLQIVANWSNESEETALIEGMSWLYTTVPSDPEATLKRLQTLSDVQLWAVVYQRLTTPDQERLSELSTRNKVETLTSDEQLELEALLALVDHQVLLRSEALLLLKQRGFEIDRYYNSLDE